MYTRVDNESLVLDLLEWVGPAPRPYDEVMNAWRTSCPRLSIWEDAVDAGLIAVRNQEVAITEAGRGFYAARRRQVPGGTPRSRLKARAKAASDS